MLINATILLKYESIDIARQVNGNEWTPGTLWSDFALPKDFRIEKCENLENQ